MEETNPIAPLFYPKITSFSEQYITDKIMANKKFNNNINAMKILEFIMKLKLITIIRN